MIVRNKIERFIISIIRMGLQIIRFALCQILGLKSKMNPTGRQAQNTTRILYLKEFYTSLFPNIY